MLQFKLRKTNNVYSSKSLTRKAEADSYSSYSPDLCCTTQNVYLSAAVILVALTDGVRKDENVK